MKITRLNETHCMELTIENNGGSKACMERNGGMNVCMSKDDAAIVVSTRPVFDFCLERKGGMKVSYGVICRTSVGKEYVFLSSDGYILSLMNRYLTGEFEKE